MVNITIRLKTSAAFNTDRYGNLRGIDDNITTSGHQYLIVTGVIAFFYTVFNLFYSKSSISYHISMGAEIETTITINIFPSLWMKIHCVKRILIEK